MTVRKMNPFVAPQYSRAEKAAGRSAPAPEAGASPPKPSAAAGLGGIDIKKIISEFKTDDYILLAALGYLFIMGVLRDSD